MMGYWVYLAYCRDQSLYCGSTTNVERRIHEHNSRTGAKYTASRVPVRLAAAWSVETWSQALRLEAFLKKRGRKVKEQLVVFPENIGILLSKAELDIRILGILRGEEKEMPIVQIEMFEGRTLEQKKRMVEKVTEALVETVGAKPENVSIIIREMAKENHARGGKLSSENQ